MLAFHFSSELGMKNLVTPLLVLLLLTHDVVSLKGLKMEEVVFASPPACATCEEIICTIATIEPANSDYKYEKYIAESLQENILEGTWQEKTDATTFEMCAAEANSADAKMFLFDDDQCKISSFAYQKKDQCSINQTQMVYIEADASPDIRVAASYRTNYFFTPYLIVGPRDHPDECAKFGAKACAPETIEDIVDYTSDLKDFAATTGFITIGLFSYDSGYNFDWVTNIAQPNDVGQNGWKSDEPATPSDTYPLECASVDGAGIITDYCDVGEFSFCCSLPHKQD